MATQEGEQSIRQRLASTEYSAITPAFALTMGMEYFIERAGIFEAHYNEVKDKFTPGLAAAYNADKAKLDGIKEGLDQGDARGLKAYLIEKGMFENKMKLAGADNGKIGNVLYAIGSAFPPTLPREQAVEAPVEPVATILPPEGI